MTRQVAAAVLHAGGQTAVYHLSAAVAAVAAAAVVAVAAAAAAVIAVVVAPAAVAVAVGYHPVVLGSAGFSRGVVRSAVLCCSLSWSIHR